MTQHLTERLRAAREGDRAALEAVLREHYDDVHRLCVRLCSHHDDAQDATQNAMIAIARGISGYDGRAAFSTWVYRITANCCTDELRRRGRRPLPTGDDLLDDVAGGSLGTTVSGGAVDDPESRALVAEQRVELQEALDELAEEFRVPVVLRDVAGLDYAEIAELCGLAPGTVRSRISRGRRHLARLLGNQPAVRDVETMDPP